MLISPVAAQTPAAVVEEVGGGVTGVQFMDYVEPGQVIRLGGHDRIVLGYLKSCWRETITGGTVTVGAEQSEVAGGEVVRAKIACEGGKMMLSAELAGKSGAMVFRQVPKPAVGRRNLAPAIHVVWTVAGFRGAPGRQACRRTSRPARRAA